MFESHAFFPNRVRRISIVGRSSILKYIFSQNLYLLNSDLMKIFLVSRNRKYDQYNNIIFQICSTYDIIWTSLEIRSMCSDHRWL